MPKTLSVLVTLLAVSFATQANDNSIDQFRQCVDCTVQEMDTFFNEADRPYEAFKLTRSSHVKGAVVLLHGLTDSPYYMKDIANMYFQNGYDVYVPLLKGHGDSYETLERVQNTEWNSEVERNIEAVSNKYSSKIMLGGFSNGALLSTVNILSEKSQNRISSLLLLSPSFNLPFMDRMKLKAAIGFEKIVNFTKWSVLRSAFDKLRVLKVSKNKAKGTTGPVRYDNIPLNGALQLGKNSNLVEKLSKNKTIDIPTVMVLSSGDPRISLEHAVRKFKKLFTGQKHLIWLQSPEGEKIAKAPKGIPAENLSVIPVNSLIGHTIMLNKIGLAKPTEQNPVYAEMERQISQLILEPTKTSCLYFY